MATTNKFAINSSKHVVSYFYLFSGREKITSSNKTIITDSDRYLAMIAMINIQPCLFANAWVVTYRHISGSEHLYARMDIYTTTLDASFW